MMTRLIPLAVLAISLAAPANAQFSDSFNFLKGVREADGTKVTELLNKPGTVIVNTRDLTTGETALHIVTARRDSAWLGFLLARGANPDTKDASGNTPLMIATQLRWADGIAALLTRRAQIDIAGASGDTPLIRAVLQNDIASVRALLGGGANPNRQNAAGFSARDYAARDPRLAPILKEITDAKPVVRREVAGPR